MGRDGGVGIGIWEGVGGERQFRRQRAWLLPARLVPLFCNPTCFDLRSDMLSGYAVGRVYLVYSSWEKFGSVFLILF